MNYCTQNEGDWCDPEYHMALRVWQGTRYNKLNEVREGSQEAVRAIPCECMCDLEGERAALFYVFLGDVRRASVVKRLERDCSISGRPVVTTASSSAHARWPGSGEYQVRGYSPHCQAWDEPLLSSERMMPAVSYGSSSNGSRLILKSVDIDSPISCWTRASLAAPDTRCISAPREEPAQSA
eukprot:scaffold11_cov257-Pinguiococcus_pyrenoidosus.AAC.3